MIKKVEIEIEYSDNEQLKEFLTELELELDIMNTVFNFESKSDKILGKIIK